MYQDFGNIQLEITYAFVILTAYSAPWWRHVKDYWELRDDPNMLVLKYESAVKVVYCIVNLF